MWNILKVNKQDTRRTSFWWLYIAKFEFIWHIILVFLLLFLKLLICDGKPFGSLRKMWSYLEFSFSYFPAFGLITGIYSLNLRTQSKCGKTRTRKTLNTDTFFVVDIKWLTCWEQKHGKCSNIRALVTQKHKNIY